jgi:hypothetical protein
VPLGRPLEVRLVVGRGIMTAALFSLPRLVELRWLGEPRRAMFTRTDTVAEALQQFQANAYITINELSPGTAELHKMPLDVIMESPHRGRCTTEEDVQQRLLLPFDSDPERPTGTAASAEQRVLAFQQSEHIQELLCALGWPEPAVVHSGNGVHRYFACDIPADRETDSLIRSFYACAARKFFLAGVKLDTSVQSRAQIMRLPGSMNLKAKRVCELQPMPADWRQAPVTLEALRAVTEQWRKDLGFKTTKIILRPGPWTPARAEAFMGFHCIDYQPAKAIPAGVMWVCGCPFDDSHRGSSPALILTNGGWLKWACKHESCQMPFREFLGKINVLTGRVYHL